MVLKEQHLRAAPVHPCCQLCCRSQASAGRGLGLLSLAPLWESGVANFAFLGGLYELIPS